MDTENRQVIFYDELPWEALPQLLSVAVGGTTYRLRPLHAGCERQECTGTARCHEGHTHDVYHLILYLTGSGAIPVDGQSVTVGPGTLVLTGPGQEHHFYPRNAAAFSYSQLTFAYETREGAALQLPLAALLRLLFGWPLPVASSYRLSATVSARLGELLARVAVSPRLRTAGVLSAAYGTIATILSFLCTDVLPGDAMAIREVPDETAARARDFVEANYATGVRVADLARRLGLSERQLQRRFKAAYGMTLIACQTACRLRRGRQLLRESGLQISEIAHRLGFSSPYYFATVFRRHTGQSPTAYRCRGR